MPRYQQSFQRVLRYSELTIRDYKICMRRTAFVEDIHKSCSFYFLFSHFALEKTASFITGTNVREKRGLIDGNMIE